ncbi:MAG TPA: hypothetical protein VI589_06920 [Vicinamibacteria bacterium]
MSDPKREKLEAEARAEVHCIARSIGFVAEIALVRDLADWAERRERGAVDQEAARWQERLHRHFPGIDGTGCESGDPLDVTDSVIERGVEERCEAAVAERDREWSAAVGSPEAPLTPDAVGWKHLDYAVYQRVTKAVAEERKALREWAESNAYDHERGGAKIIFQKELLAALDAREERKPGRLGCDHEPPCLA